jgi:large conductance mechanosensitive channel
LGVFTGVFDFSNQAIFLQDATAQTEAVTLNYGLFLNALLEFVIIAFVVFLVVRYMNELRGQDTAAEPAQ